jgi:hypothetical protein
MRKLEAIAWLLAILNAIAAIGIGWQLRVCKAEKLHAAEVVFQCGKDLEAKSDLCTESSIEYMKRGNLLFECEQRICEVNGWGKPMGWDEEVEAVEKHKERYGEK